VLELRGLVCMLVAAQENNREKKMYYELVDMNFVNTMKSLGFFVVTCFISLIMYSIVYKSK
jgi:hypothetical protein